MAELAHLQKFMAQWFFSLFLIFSLFPASIALAGTDGQNDLPEICEQVKNTPFPPGDRPTPDEIKTLTNCDSEALYYGIGRTPDPVTARKCAYLEKKTGDGLVFGGSSMLMLIYANGKWAKRNFDLALRLACEIGGAPAEIQGRTEHLARLKAEGWNGSDFSLCDDITSGYMMGFCAAHEERFASEKRSKALAALMAKWNPEERSAFAALRKAADEYFKARAENEVDMSGTARGALFIEENSSLEEGFLAFLTALESGKAPRYSPRDFDLIMTRDGELPGRDGTTQSSRHNFDQADAELNSLYQYIRKDPNFSYGTVTKEGIKTAEISWIRYRDAWVQFGKSKYPFASSEVIMTWLTLERIKMLGGFYGVCYESDQNRCP